MCRSDGSLGPWTPVWVVVAGDDVLVRTWLRRDSGWYGGVLRSRSARIRWLIEHGFDPGTPGAEFDVLRARMPEP